MEEVLLSILDVPLLLASDDPALLAELQGTFGHYCAKETTARPAITLRLSKVSDSSHRASCAEREVLLQWDGGWPQPDDLVKLLVESVRTDLCFVHASCIASQGAAALLVGSSTCGKTTLALAMQEQGWDTVADDTAAIDMSSRRVHSFRTQPRLRAYTSQLIGERGWDDRYYRRSLPFHAHGIPVRWLIFLRQCEEQERPASATLPPGLPRWKDMQTLCYGERTPREVSVPRAFVTRAPADFDRPPVVMRCGLSESLRLLASHSHSSPSSLAQQLEFLLSLLSDASAWTLLPGHLSATINALTAVLESRPEIADAPG